MTTLPMQESLPGLPERQEITLQGQPLTPLELVRFAVSNNASVEQLAKLMDLQERWEANEARKAFVRALTEFKKNPPRIAKNKHVKITPKDPTKFGAEYDHATLDLVCDVVATELTKYGISHRWKVEQPDNNTIRVTCILTHEQGHSEETTLGGPADLSGGKNPIQAVGSTVTYLERYTLLAATGLAAGGTDTDARTPAESSEEFASHLDNISNATAKELKGFFATAWKAFPNNKTLLATYTARKKELGLL